MNALRDNLFKITSGLPDGVRIIAVSKTKPLELIREAYEAGQRLFGENRVQEILWKAPELPADIQWHLIGHLQTNKVKQVLPYVSMIHSVDSIRLLETIQKEAAKINRVIPCLLQVHIAMEETKFGFSAEELNSFFEKLNPREYPNIQFAGLMGMASFVDDEDQVRKEFRSLKILFDHIQIVANHNLADFKELSMGMSGDYPIAVSEGSTLVRIGTLLFGIR